MKARKARRAMQDDSGRFAMIPLMQAMVIAGALGIIGFVGGLLAAYLLRLPWQFPCLSGLLGIGIVGPVVAVAFQARAHQLLVHTIEDRLGWDLDGDGVVGDSTDNTRPWEVPFAYVRSSGTPAPRDAKAIEQATFRKFLTAVFRDGQPTTWRYWEGEGLTQDQWAEYCNRLLRAGLCERSGQTNPIVPVEGATLRDALLSFREAL